MRARHLVLVHGTFGSGSDWERIEHHVRNQTNYTTSAITLPGHANRPLEEHPSAFLQLISALRAELTQPSIVIGYSLGGRIALQTVLQHVDSLPVMGLVLEGAHPGLSDPAERLHRAQEDRSRAQQIRALGLPHFLKDWYRLPLFALEEQNEQTMEAFIHERAQHRDPNAIARILEESSPGRVPSLWHDIPTLKVPLCFIHGENDPKYAGVAREIQRIHPPTSISAIPRAGHNTHRDAPDAFTDALLAFVERVNGGA